MSPINDDTHYRRGVVLGLTMAEIMLLLLFVLMIALSVLIRDQAKELAETRELLEAREAEVTALSAKLDEVVAQSLDTRESFSDTFRELILVTEENRKIEREIAQLTERVEDLEQEEERLATALERATETAREFQQLEQWLAESGGPTSPAAVVSRLERSEELERVVAQSGFPNEPDALGAALAEAAKVRRLVDELAGKRDTAEQRLAFFRRQAGLSDQPPSCWIDEDSKAEYIFDVLLQSGGIVIIDRDLEHRREEKAKLPIRDITYAAVLQPTKFSGQVLPLYEWSVRNECRFYVRVFDRTASDQKDLYKALLQRVEAYFFKYLVSDATAEPGTV